MTYVGPRPMLQVALEPFTAAWLATRLSDAWWAQQIEALERASRADLAGSLRRDRARLAEAQRAWRERQSDAPVPTVGTSELPTSTPPAALSQDDWMSVPEASEVLGVSEVMVRRMCRNGVLEGRKLHARQWLVSRSSVEAHRAARGAA